MTDNTDLAPSKYRVAYRDLRRDTRTYKCRGCGWTTPPVRDGAELRKAVRQGHFCFTR